MTIQRFGAALAGSVLLGVSLMTAQVEAAVSVTNRDDKDHKLTVIEDEGAAKADHTLKPNQVLEGVCAKGCVIRLNDSEEDEYELEGTEVVSIEEGYLYYDGPEGTEQPNQGSAPPPSAPGAKSAPAPAAPPAKQ